MTNERGIMMKERVVKTSGTRTLVINTSNFKKHEAMVGQVIQIAESSDKKSPYFRAKILDVNSDNKTVTVEHITKHYPQ